MCLAIPGEVLEVDRADALPMARVSFGGVVRRICLAYTPDAATGDFVLAHAGFSISILDADEGRRRLTAFGAGGETP